MLFGMPRLVIFLGRCRIGLFSINVCIGVFSLLRSVIFFFAYSITAVQCHPKWTSVECARNTIGDLDGKLFERQWIRKHPRWYEKYYWPALMKNKNIAQCRPKNKYSSARISGEVCPHISVWCSLRQFWAIAFLLNPLIIFGWCRYGNVRLASFGDSFRDTATGNRSWPMSARIVFYPSLSRIFFAAMVGYIFLCLFYQCRPMSTETQRRLMCHEIQKPPWRENLSETETKKAS